jgi:hypothetical protein
VLGNILVLRCQGLGDFFEASANNSLTINTTEILVLLFLGKSDPVYNKVNKAFIKLKRCFDSELLLFLSHKLCLV